MPRTKLNCAKCSKEIPARETKKGLAHKRELIVPAHNSVTKQEIRTVNFFHQACSPATL